MESYVAMTSGNLKIYDGKNPRKEPVCLFMIDFQKI